MEKLSLILKMTSGIVFLLLLGKTTEVHSQNNSLVINGAYIILDGGNATNNINVVVNQPSPLGITRSVSGGHIHSENQYNYIKWVVNSNLGSYVFPFGVGANASDYIPFTFNKTVGNSNVSMSTWATNQQNIPKPGLTNVGAVTNMFGTADSVLFAIDRFWDIQAPATTADLTFSYRGIENTTSSPTNLVMGQHWNGNIWDSQVGSGVSGVTVGIGTTGPFIGQTTFSPWVLTISCDVTIDTSGITPFCFNDAAVNLTAISPGGIWNGTGITDTINGTFDPNIAGVGNHSITYTLGCGDTDTITVIVIPQDDASFIYTQNVYCVTDSNPIPSSITTNGGFFSIDNSGTINASTGEINIAASGVGNFVVTYITAGTCLDTATFNFTIITCLSPIANFMASDTFICEGDCIDYTDLSTGALSWAWTFTGGNPTISAAQNPTVCYAIAGVYTSELIVSNSIGSDTIIQTITVIATPTIIASPNVTITIGQSTTLTAAGSGGTYTWSPPNGLSCTMCQTTITSPEETTTYTVTLDSNGCSVSDDVIVIVDFTNIIFVPNIFSPNGDGSNDIVFVEGKTIETLNFFIYDRWGEKVFETTNKEKGWDGTFKGKAMNKAVFVYYVDVTFKDGTKAIKKGDITLMR